MVTHEPPAPPQPTTPARVAPRGSRGVVADILPTVALVLGGLWFYAPFLHVDFGEYDLGLAMYGATRVLAGAVPYADFHTPYGPGQYYIRAAFFALFGEQVRTFAYEQVLFTCLYVGVFYLALRNVLARGWALVLTLVVATVAFFALQQHAIMNVMMVAAIACAVRYTARRDVRWLVAGGVAAGMTAVNRWDFGIYCAFAICVSLAALPALARIAGDATWRWSWRDASGRIGMFLAAAAAVALPWFLPVLVREPGAFVRSVRLAQGVHDYRTLPWPELPSVRAIALGQMTFPQFLEKAMVAFPANAAFVVVPLNVLLVVFLVAAKVRVRPGVPLLAHTAVTAVLTGLLFIYAAARSDIGHTLPLTIMTVLNLPLTFWFLARVPFTSWVRASVGVVVGALLVPLALFGIQTCSQRRATPPPPAAFAESRLAGTATTAAFAKQYDALVAYVRQNTADDEPIFSGLVRHDRVNVNDVLLYYAADRPSAVTDYHMDPGSTTRGDVQQRMANELRQRRTRLLVLADFNLPMENNLSRTGGATVLDEYIREHYAVREQFPMRYGSYYVLHLRSSASMGCAIVPAPMTYGSIDLAVNPATGAATAPRDGQFKIFGWAATPVGEPTLDHIEVRVNDQIVWPVLQCIPYDDLVKVFGPGARYSAWMVSVDARAIAGNGPLTISAHLVDTAGRRHPLGVTPSARFAITP